VVHAWVSLSSRQAMRVYNHSGKRSVGSEGPRLFTPQLTTEVLGTGTITFPVKSATFSSLRDEPPVGCKHGAGATRPPRGGRGWAANPKGLEHTRSVLRRVRGRARPRPGSGGLRINLGTRYRFLQSKTGVHGLGALTGVPDRSERPRPCHGFRGLQPMQYQLVGWLLFSPPRAALMTQGLARRGSTHLSCMGQAPINSFFLH